MLHGTVFVALHRVFSQFAYVSLINVSVHICSSTFPDVYSTPGRNLELCMRADLFRYIAHCSSFAEGRLLGRMTSYGPCGAYPKRSVHVYGSPLDRECL